jgi:hypothetical protein
MEGGGDVALGTMLAMQAPEGMMQLQAPVTEACACTPVGAWE